MIRCIQIGTTTIQGEIVPDIVYYFRTGRTVKKPTGTITNCGTVFRGKPIETVRKETT